MQTEIVRDDHSCGVSMRVVANVGIAIGVGLALFFVLGQIVDAAIYRIAVGPGDPIENISRQGPSKTRQFLLNILRPVVLTTVIFGGGLTMAAILQFTTVGTVSSCVWFFFLTQIACLAGRRESLYESGWAMVGTTCLLVGCFVTWRNFA